VALFGAVMGLWGYFYSRDRLDFYDSIIHSDKGILITHRAAGDFMKKFPPPLNFKEDIVEIIKTHKLQTEEKFPFGIGVLRYRGKNGKESSPVATFEQARLWSEETWRPLFDLSIICALFLIAFADLLSEVAKKLKDKIPRKQK
jgi:hypothetical protein